MPPLKPRQLTSSLSVCFSTARGFQPARSATRLTPTLKESFNSTKARRAKFLHPQKSHRPRRITLSAPPTFDSSPRPKPPEPTLHRHRPSQPPNLRHHLHQPMMKWSLRNSWLTGLHGNLLRNAFTVMSPIFVESILPSDHTLQSAPRFMFRMSLRLKSKIFP